MVAGYIFLTAAFSDMCRNEIFTQIESPDKHHKAVLFQRDCGATTGFSTQISILNKNDKLENESGNIFIAEDHPDRNKLELAWVNSNTLLVRNINRVNTFKKETTFGKVLINYE